MRSCIENLDIADKYNDNLDEGESFNLTATPATLMLNTITRKRAIIQGAYPVDVFTDALTELMIEE